MEEEIKIDYELILSKKQELFDSILSTEKQKGERVCKFTQAKIYERVEFYENFNKVSSNLKKTLGHPIIERTHYTSGKKIGFFDEVFFFPVYEISNSNEEKYSTVFSVKKN